MGWAWGIIAAAFSLSLLSLRGERRRAAMWRKRLDGRLGPKPPATVIVPVKGRDEGLAENLRALASLDYPDYELIVCAGSPADLPQDCVPPSARIVYSNPPGAKTTNLLAALAAARAESAVFAFADSDGRPEPAWLQALVAPLFEPGTGAATGYRFFLPDRPTFPSLLRSVWDSVVLESFRTGEPDFAWGGAMAIKRDMLFKARVPDLWKTAVSDDYALADAVRRAGLEIRFCPAALVPARDGTTLRGFFRFARRQLILTRAHRPRNWAAAFAATALYCAGMAACAARAPWFLPVLLAPGICKSVRRAALARASLPRHAEWFRRNGWAHVCLGPLATWAWFFALSASACSNTFEWRGTRYRMR